MSTHEREVALEFWIATATAKDGDLYWSEIVWGDGMEARDALREAKKWLPDNLDRVGCDLLSIHGPYTTNSAAAQEIPE